MVWEIKRRLIQKRIPIESIKKLYNTMKVKLGENKLHKQIPICYRKLKRKIIEEITRIAIEVVKNKETLKILGLDEWKKELEEENINEEKVLELYSKYIGKAKDKIKISKNKKYQFGKIIQIVNEKINYTPKNINEYIDYIQTIQKICSELTEKRTYETNGRTEKMKEKLHK